MDAQYGFLVHIGKREHQIGFVDLNHRSRKQTTGWYTGELAR